MKILANAIYSQIPQSFWERIYDSLPSDWEVIEVKKTEELNKKLSKVDYYIGFPISGSILRRNKNIKGLFLLSSQIPESYSKLDCEVHNITGINAKAVADHALYFSLRNIKEREMAKNANKLKVGLIGLGAVGEEIKKNHSSIFPLFDIITRKEGYSSYQDYEKFLQNKDVLLISVSLNKQTRELFSVEKFFKNLKNDVTIINIARGELFIEQDLVDWFEKNTDSRYYTDVVYPEPYPKEGALNKLENIFITPHQAGFYEGLWDEVFLKWEQISWIK